VLPSGLPILVAGLVAVVVALFAGRRAAGTRGAPAGVGRAERLPADISAGAAPVEGAGRAERAGRGGDR
jgi:hypothetical protein